MFVIIVLSLQFKSDEIIFLSIAINSKILLGISTISLFEFKPFNIQYFELNSVKIKFIM